MVCRDGVLVASDSMGSSGTIAVRLPKARALTNEAVVWVSAGSTYVGQCVERAIAAHDGDDPEPATPTSLATALRPVITDAYGVSNPPPGGERLDGAESETLLLGWRDGEPSFVHLRADTAPVDKTQEMFHAIGSGHDFAHVSYIALSHHVTEPLPLHQGLLLAYRIISIVCEASSWGVGLPVQLAVADCDGARVLGTDEVEEISTGVQRWLVSDATSFNRSDVSSPPVRDLPTLFNWAGTEDAG
jgi:hypothetical protein